MPPPRACASAATLRASIDQRPVGPQASLAPGSEEAKAAWRAACHEHSIRTVPLQDCPDLMRTEQDVWSTESLMRAMTAGEITVAEYARLYPIASERELRFAQISHELNIGGLFALAYADEYPVKDEGSDAPVSALASALNLGADAEIAELAEEFCRAYRLNDIADRAMMAGSGTEAEWKPHYDATIALSRKLEAATPTTLIAMALKCLAPVGLIAWELSTHDDPAARGYKERIAAQFQAAILAGTLAPPSQGKAQPPTSSLVEMLDLGSATMGELQVIHEVAERIGSIAYAHAWGPRCRRGENKHGAPYHNAAGDLVNWIGDALTAVEAAVHKEARRRTPTHGDDREARLSLLAVTTIDNGDPDETEGFARELLAHAAAWREGC
jgi:hypothetical protein